MRSPVTVPQPRLTIRLPSASCTSALVTPANESLLSSVIRVSAVKTLMNRPVASNWSCLKENA